MRFWLIIAVVVECISLRAAAQDTSASTMTHPSAQNEVPPSVEKQELIRRFMRASGLQARLDSGSFVERYAFNPDLDWTRGRTEITYREAIMGPIEALKAVYEKYRPEYQEAYQSHIHWEFTEEELRQMVSFLESPIGQHYLEGTWRMEAYTGTNMEATEEALVNEALALFQSQARPSDPNARDD